MNTSSDFARTFVIATDGYVTVEKEAFALIKSNLNKASFFTFGIGSSVNRHLLEGMAHAGAGEAVVITNEKEASEKAEEFRKLLSSPLLTNIDISFNGFDAYDFEPSSVPDMFASRPVVIFGKYRGNPTGTIKLTGSNGDGKYAAAISVADAKPSAENQALKYLWAREKIRMIDDYSGGYGGVPEDVEKLVTSLGIEYNLLTAYTSFVAIDTEIRNDGKPVVTVRQPLPLPQGVSNYAVGAVNTGASSPKMSRGEAVSCAFVVKGLDVEEVREKEAFIVVETMPSFPGGQKALENYLKINLKYPEAAKNGGIKGTVFVSFVVERDGSLSDIRVLRGIGSGCDEEVIRLVKNMPKWKPGKQRGKAVRVSMNLPVTFDSTVR
jgi:Ca-activated chloride channel family protein